MAQVPAPDKEPFLTTELTAGQGRMASAPCLFITPLQLKENTPAHASRARTCTPSGQTDACSSRTCLLSTLGDRGRDAAAPQQQGLFSILAGDRVGKLRTSISKSFTSRLSTTVLLEQEGGREQVWPDPAAPLCPPHPCRQSKHCAQGLEAPATTLSKGLCAEEWLRTGKEPN